MVCVWCDTCVHVCVPCANTWRLEEYTMCLLYHSPHSFGKQGLSQNLKHSFQAMLVDRQAPRIYLTLSPTPVLQVHMVTPDFYVGIGM